MAGMHFIILKVNGVDVSQMPHEEAIQMFLKAPEPIVVEVRRRSYNVNDDAESSYGHSNMEEKSSNLITQQQRQTKDSKDTSSPTSMSLKTNSHSEEYQHQHHHSNRYQQHRQVDQSPAAAIASAVDSLKLHSLIISPASKNSNSRDVGYGIPNTNNASIQNRINGTESPTTGAGLRIHANVNQKSKSVSLSSINSPGSSAASSPVKESTATGTTILPTTGNASPLIGDGKIGASRLVSVGIQTDNFTTDYIFAGSSILDSAEQIIDNDHNLFTECLAPEIDIEEITLRKLEGNGRLGLTVCYSSGGGNGSGSDDTDTGTEVYISDIIADSIAGRDGRLRQGDQILQVNGKDVTNKEETETLIAENNNAVTLLVSRYLYGDDIEYNEQEVEGEYYEDEPNMAYANCFLENYVVSDDLQAVPSQASTESPEKKQLHQAVVEEHVNLSSEGQQHPQLVRPVMSTEVSATVSENIPINSTTLTYSSSRDPLNHQNIRAHLDQVNQEIAILDSRVENMMMSQKKTSENPSGFVSSQKQKPQPSTTNNKSKESPAVSIMEYDTEHIYETIPEDSESEPFYCSPYESSEHQNRVEQWLDMQDVPESNDGRIHSLQHCKQHQCTTQQQQQQHQHQQQSQQQNIWTRAKNGTLHSTNSSAGDDHENSSSAYNTGGSCNSNTMVPLTLELNTANYRERELNSQQHSQSTTLILCPTNKQHHSISPSNETISSNPMQHKFPSSQMQTSQGQELKSVNTSYRHSKEKLLSPSHVPSKSTVVIAPEQQAMLNKQKVFPFAQKNSQNNSNSSPIPTANTMYTNVANLQQTMLLQQQLFRRALIHQRVPSNSTIPCPQFTAPNLSQYHFVSSQEVSTVKLNTNSNEEQMVWKVKRRQDGTRYIVRRPARNRFLRNRAIRINAERNNDHTTEDDTISEIKTGRYWTKEERKKHIERARERRQRQQLIITNKNNEVLTQSSTTAPASAMNCSENANKGGGVDSFNQSLQQKIPNQNTTVAAVTNETGKSHRHNNQSSTATTKKLIKKTNTISPTIDVNNCPLLHMNSAGSSATPITSSTTMNTVTTTTNTPTASKVSGAGNIGGSGSNSNRMFQGSTSNIGGNHASVSSTAYQHTKVTHPSL